MQLGIMAMQIPMLLPAGASPEAALQHIAAFDHATLVRRIAQQGFRLIELGGDLTLFLPHTFAPPAIERLAALQRELGLEYTVHLPLWSVEPSTPLTPVRQGSVQALVDTVRATLPLEPRAYVLHATGALAAEFYRMNIPDTARSLLLRLFQGGAQESIRTLLQETGLPSRKLAIETIEFPFELTLELAEALDLSICLDTGHILAGFSGPLDLFTVLERVLPRLGEIHLHDCPAYARTGALGYGLDHQPLGAGDLDVRRLLERLEAAHWAGPIIFELRLDQALDSLQHLRSLGLPVEGHIAAG